MKIPPIPEDEAERLAALRSLDILDTPAEERFDRITRVARTTFGVPIALISLVDANRQWFKSRFGLDVGETPREVSFCGHAILSRDTFVIEDALVDPRFVDNPLVTEEPRIRFYAGHRLVGPGGHHMGTLCVIDRRPRQLDPPAVQALQDLAAWAERELNAVEWEEAARKLRQSENRFHAIFHSAALGIALVDRDGRLLSCNRALGRIFGYSPQELVVHEKLPFQLVVESEAIDASHLEPRAGEPGGHQVDVRSKRKDGEPIWLTLTVSRVEDEGGSEHFRILMFDEITQRHRAKEQLNLALEAEQAARRRLERLNQVQSQFISMVTHDFRTALTGIQGFSEMMRDEEFSPEEMREYATDINEDAKRMNALIASMLELSKGQDGSSREAS